MGRARHDQNLVPTLIAVSNQDGATPIEVWADESTHEILVKATISGSVSTTSPILLSKIDTTSTSGVTYIGKAAPGSTGSQAVWQIKKLDTNTLALDKTYAASGAFTQIWDNRTGLTYA